MFFKPIAVAAFALINQTIAYTTEEILDGRVPGFHSLGDLQDRWPGDFLLSTWCFCAAPTPVPGNYSEAHWLQFEYYNHQRDTTFLLTQLCQAKQDSDQTCLAPRNGLHRVNDWLGWQEKLCKTWRRAVHDPNGDGERMDELCYFPSKHSVGWLEFRVPDEDEITWNKQERELDQNGNQGALLKDYEEAAASCEVLCPEHAKMPMLKGNTKAVSHVVAYEKMDDMCDDCE